MSEEAPPTPPDHSADKDSPKSIIHEADLASGVSGGVIRGAEVEFTAAIALRMKGQNIVVCGDDLRVNRALAGKIELAVGPCVRSVPHKRTAGPRALPHFQQQDPTHPGHTFYETSNQKAEGKKS